MAEDQKEVLKFWLAGVLEFMKTDKLAMTQNTTEL
jgi:hypothetical protein